MVEKTVKMELEPITCQKKIYRCAFYEQMRTSHILRGLTSSTTETYTAKFFSKDFFTFNVKTELLNSKS